MQTVVELHCSEPLIILDIFTPTLSEYGSGKAKPRWFSQLECQSAAHCVTSSTPTTACKSWWVRSSTAMLATNRSAGVTRKEVNLMSLLWPRLKN